MKWQNDTPGTHLKSFFGKLGFGMSPKCHCALVMEKMNGWGYEKCRHEERFRFIIRSIRDEVAVRGLRYLIPEVLVKATVVLSLKHTEALVLREKSQAQPPC